MSPQTAETEAAKLRALNQEQRQAIQSLELALARCHKAGVALCGMDSDLYAYRADDFARLDRVLPSAYEVQEALHAADTAHHVEDHGAYRESGGW